MSFAVSLFELARELSQAHERSALSNISVIPVILDDLRAAKSTLAALADAHEGCFLDTSAYEHPSGGVNLHAPVLGTDDVVRRTAVETALRTAAGRSVLLTEQSGGFLDAELQHPEAGGSPSPGDRTITAIARAAVHRDLDQCSFAVLSYESGSLDLQFRQAVWDLMVGHLNGMPSTRLRTLVVAVEAAIDIDLHCQSGRGFRFAIERGRLLRRQGADSLRSSVRQIANHEAPLVFFLGAGFGVSSRLPLGDTVRDTAIRRLLNLSEEESPTSTTLAVRFHEWLAEKADWLTARERTMPQEEFARALTLERVLDIERRVDGALPTLADFREHHDRVIENPGAAVLGFSDILQRRPGRIIVVGVNFDRLIERHAGVGIRVFASEEDFSDGPAYIGEYLAGREQDVPVLKVHGTIELPETCIVTQEQTELGVTGGKLETLRALLGSSDAPRLWIYVGASMRDRDLLRVLVGGDFAEGLDERWVSPFVVGSVEDYAESRAAVWSSTTFPKLEDRVITETSDAFFSALVEELPVP